MTAIDEAASELIDPDFERPLRPVAAVAQLEFEEQTTLTTTVTLTASEPAAVTEPPRPAGRRTGRRPVIPAWEDVLLGVRTGGER